MKLVHKKTKAMVEKWLLYLQQFKAFHLPLLSKCLKLFSYVQALKV